MTCLSKAMSAQGLTVSLCRRTLRLYLQISIHTLTVSSRCCQSYLGRLHEGVECYNIHSVILAILEDTIVELKEHRNDQEIKENHRKQWKALRQVPDVDEGSGRPSNIGESSLQGPKRPAEFGHL